MTNKSTKLYLLIIFSIAIAIYWPSMSGPFLFDDFINLQSLGINDGIRSVQAWLDFVFGGGSSFLGRPLALATFTLNAQSWPADPLPFKITNILIHCFNGLLVFWFLKKLMAFRNQNNDIKISNFLPLVGAAIWLIHPVHLTTILQVVQRMTLLSGTFTLISLIAYTDYLNNNKLALNKSFTLLIIFLCTMGILGILSKETAIATPLFMFALNYTVFRKHLSKTTRLTLVWQIMLLLGPILLFLLGTLYLNKGIEQLWQARGFSLIERVLTESRILFQYLSSIYMPKVSGSGLFHDDIIISKNLFDPFSTILSVTGILSLIIIAVKANTTKPFLSLGILWFFLGHIFESTIWPLELYFEHRNYLPSLCLVFFLIQLSLTLAEKPKKIFISLASVYLILVATITAINTPIWGNKLTLFTTWAEENPRSIRAQHAAAMTWLVNYNDPASARVFLIQALNTNPMSVGTRLRLIQNYCYFEKTDDNLKSLISGLENLEPDALYLNAIADIVSIKEKDLCRSLNTSLVIDIMTILENNPKIAIAAGSWLLYHKSRILFVAHKNNEALEYANKAYRLTPFLGTSILKIEIAMQMNDKILAKQYLEEALQMEESQYYLLDNVKAEKYQRLKSLL